MLPSDLLQAYFTMFVIAPAFAAILAFKGPPLLRQISRWVLLGAWLAHGAATLACLRYAFAGPSSSSGIGNGVFLFPAIPLAFFAILSFVFWRGARRYEYLQTLPPDLRRAEELKDIEEGLAGARKSLERCKRRLDSWTISGEEREQLKIEIDLIESTILSLERQRAERSG
jgi:hypothetical protein